MKKAYKYLLLSFSFLLTLLLLSPRTAQTAVFEEEPIFNTSDFYAKEEVSDEMGLSDAYERVFSGNSYQYEIVSSTKFEKKFIGYADSPPILWSKISECIVSPHQEFVASRKIPFEGETVDVFYRSSLENEAEFSADDSKFSTLGLFADFTVRKVKIISHNPYSGQPTVSTYTTDVTYDNFYMQLVYK